MHMHAVQHTPYSPILSAGLAHVPAQAAARLEIAQLPGFLMAIILYGLSDRICI